MKEFEIHVFVSYMTDGGSKEHDCYLEYITAKNKREAKKLLRASLTSEGYKVIRMDALEA